MKDYCEVCNDDREYEVRESNVTKKVRGKEIEYPEKKAFCKVCNSRMYIPSINDENLDALYSKLEK